MSDTAAETASREETSGDQIVRNDDGKFVCPECGKEFGWIASVHRHRLRQHGVGGEERAEEPPPRRRPRPRGDAAPRSRRGENERLRRELKKSVSALLLLPFMLNNSAEALLVPGVSDVLDARAESFADSWVMVAEQNEFVRANLLRLLSGGVWLNAATQTTALLYSVAVFARYIPMHPGALMLMPDLRQFTFVPTPPGAPPPASAAPSNGGETVGAEGA
jgi:hypothetical protein